MRFVTARRHARRDCRGGIICVLILLISFFVFFLVDLVFIDLVIVELILLIFLIQFPLFDLIGLLIFILRQFVGAVRSGHFIERHRSPVLLARGRKSNSS
jgi:hypothetical protein